MDTQTNPTSSDLAPLESEWAHPPPLAYFELGERQVFALAFVLVTHFRHVGPPTTPIQKELVGLRNYLVDLLRERQAEVLLSSGE